MVAKIALIYYSTWGHVRTLAKEVEAGLKSTGASVDVFQVQETLSEEVLEKMHAAPKDTSVPVLEDVNILTKYDGYAFGYPTRYGRAPAQVSALFDRTGGLWAKGELFGKFATVFTSSGSQHGGQETTALTTYPFFAHQGIIMVPISFPPQLMDNSEIIGGAAYGAGTVAGPKGERQPNEKELGVAKYQGTHFANIVNTYVKGKSA